MTVAQRSRRPHGRGRGAAVVLLAVILLSASGCWWEQTGFGPERTYSNGSESALTAATVRNARRLWGDVGLEQAVLVNGTVYSVEGGLVTAYRATTGAIRWQRYLDVGWSSPPLVHDGVVYVASYRIVESCDPNLPACFSQPADVAVRRLDAATGAVLPDLPWAGSGWAPAGPLALGDGYLVSLRGWFPIRFASEVTDPDSLWVHDLSGATPDRFVPITTQSDDLPPVIDSGRHQVVVGGDSGVEAMPLACAAPCTPTWRRDGPVTAFAAQADTVVVATGAGEVLVLDARTGAVRTTLPVDAGPAALAAGGDTIVSRTPAGLKAFRSCPASGCTPAWRSSLPAYGQPVIAGNLVYANSGPDPISAGLTLDAYRLNGCGASTCAPVARLPAFGGRYGPVVAQGILVAGTDVFGLPAPP